jgi:hypothetical protein
MRDLPLTPTSEMVLPSVIPVAWKLQGWVTGTPSATKKEALLMAVPEGHLEGPGWTVKAAPTLVSGSQPRESPFLIYTLKMASHP